MIRVISVHHHALRVGASDDALAEARRFYGHVLQLASDPGRPEIDGVPGEWLYAGDGEHRSQIHLIAAAGV
ncbi:MAG TPA: glyoxalase, partial [Thermoanaerobaculia bacterium]|nr:glyoxalase [Thermoanaerobaculia bacterium]